MCKNAPEDPHEKLPRECSREIFLVLTGNFSVLTKMYTKVGSVNFHMSYFSHVLFLGH